jgi:SAM-dependent methyltransferase
MQKEPDTAIPTCPVCLSSKATHFQVSNNCTLYRCEGCEVVYLFPHVSVEQAVDLYNSTVERASTEQHKRFDKKMRRSRSRARRLKSYVKGSGKRFIDVGCNVGFMTEAARESGFDATGIEIDANYIKTSQEAFPKNTFVHSLVEDYTSPEGGFDMVYCSEVIEHVPDPRAFAAGLARQVAPGGYLFITTPDISHWRRPKDITQWNAFCPPEHCLYFSPANLKHLFELNGLVLKKKFLAFKPGIKMLFQRPASE